MSAVIVSDKIYSHSEFQALKVSANLCYENTKDQCYFVVREEDVFYSVTACRYTENNTFQILITVSFDDVSAAIDNTFYQYALDAYNIDLSLACA